MSHRPLYATRRQLLAAAALLPLAGPALAQKTRATPTAVGVFALLGDEIQLAFPADVTDTRIDRTLHESLKVADVGLDQAALRGAHARLSAILPRARLQMYRAPQPMTAQQQRELADGATRAELPGWIVGALQQARLSHLLLITRTRGEANFALADGHSIGRGQVEGVGFYLDSSTEIKNAQTGLSSRGFLGSYVQLRLQLLEVASGDIVAQDEAREGRMAAGRRDADTTNPWEALSPREKVEVLRDMVQAGSARVTERLLARF